MKQKIYEVISKTGIVLLTKAFPEYFAKEPLASTDRYIEYPFAIKNLPRPPAKILDVGCSGSFFPLLLASFGYETYGIDIRDYAIINRIKFDNFCFIKGDIKKTTIPDSFFEAITAISTIEHIGILGRYGADEDAEADKKALKEIKRILKPNGILLLTVPFGRAKVIKPYTRIYDDILLKKLVADFFVELEEYYMQDNLNNWFKCSKDSALLIDAKTDRYPLCLLKLKNKGS